MKHRFVSWSLGLLFCLAAATCGSQDLQARLENSLRNARSLTSVEIQMLEAYRTSRNDGKPDFSSTFQYTYVVSGPKFRATCKLVSATQTNTTKLSEAAFNGRSFVTYNADTRRMTRQGKIGGSSNSELPVNPLIAPFCFLSRNADDCLTCLLRFTDIKSPDFAKGVILPKGQQSNGLVHIVMPGLPIAKKPTSWRIDVDESSDSFTPKTITWTVEAGGQITYTLLNYTNLSGYQFPTTVKCVATTYPPTSPPTVTSDEITTVSYVRIPQHIPDSTFEIDERLADRIWDADNNKFLGKE
jgi:hypothetical protein